MAQTVTFRSVPRHAVISQKDHDWMQCHLGTALPIFQLTFDKTGSVATMAVHTEESCISIFCVTGLEYIIKLPEVIQNVTDDAVVSVIRVCMRCGKTSTIKLPVDRARLFFEGLAIQYALPDLSADEREWLLSSICPECWRKLA